MHLLQSFRHWEFIQIEVQTFLLVPFFCLVNSATWKCRWCVMWMVRTIQQDLLAAEFVKAGKFAYFFGYPKVRMLSASEGQSPLILWPGSVGYSWIQLGTLPLVSRCIARAPPSPSRRYPKETITTTRLVTANWLSSGWSNNIEANDINLRIYNSVRMSSGVERETEKRNIDVGLQYVAHISTTWGNRQPFVRSYDRRELG